MRSEKKTSNLFHILLLLLLAAAMLFSLSACSGKAQPQSSSAPASEPVSLPEEAESVGQGAKSFTFEAVDAEGGTKTYTVNTDAETVGDALLENGLIEGEDGPYGLYVKTVCGITVDYDADGKYWAFYENGEYAASGVDQTEITDGTSYSFRVE